MYGKQCRPWSDALFFGIWSGSTLFEKAYLSQYLRLLQYCALILVYSVWSLLWINAVCELPDMLGRLCCLILKLLVLTSTFYSKYYSSKGMVIPEILCCYYPKNKNFCRQEFSDLVQCNLPTTATLGKSQNCILKGGGCCAVVKYRIAVLEIRKVAVVKRWLLRSDHLGRVLNPLRNKGYCIYCIYRPEQTV